MAQQLINIGTTPNDGTGDPLRDAFDKINDNTTELYSAGSLSLADDVITFTKADGTTSTINISAYMDEDARAISSGTLNPSTGIVTFTRDDASTFTLDLSALLDDTNLVSSVNTQTGAVVLDADDIDDSATTNKFTSAADISKLAGIEAGAEVNTVDSVNTQTGAVVLDSDDIAEGTTNLYDKTVSLTQGSNISITGTYPSFTIAAQNLVTDSSGQALAAATSLTLVTNTLTLTKGDGTTDTVDLTPYLDEDARAIASGVLNASTGIVTFTRDDASTFTLDLSALLDDTNLVTSVNGASGVVVLNTDNIAQGSTNLYDKTVTLTQGSNVTITGSYPNFTISSTDTNTQLSTEQVQDIVGAMVSGNTESNITVTYNDTTGKLDFTANAGDITGVTAGSGLSGGGTSGTVTLNHADTSSAANLTASGRRYVTGLTFDTYGHVTGYTTGTETVTDTNTTYTAGAGLDLNGTVFSVESDLRGDVFYIGRDTNDYYLVNTTTHDWRLDGNLDMRLENDGDLHVDGDVIAYSTTTSDRRLKDNIKTIDSALEKVEKLRGVEYDWNATSRKGQHDMGVIAQEIEEVFPFLVREKELQTGEFAENPQTFKTVDYEKLVGVLIESVKELSAEVKELKSKI